MTLIFKPRVAENSTSTGTGAFTLSSALVGHQRFNAVCTTGNTVEYVIAAADGTWEEGLGTYSGTNTLTRTTVTNSSNAGSAVSFASGAKIVMLTPSARRVQGAEELVSIATASSSAYIAFTNLEAGYWHRFVGANLVYSGGSSLGLNISQNNGSTWNGGSADFSNYAALTSAGNTNGHIVEAANGHFETKANDLNSATEHSFKSWPVYGVIAGAALEITSDYLINQTAINAVRFIPDSGTITSGTIAYFRTKVVP